MKTYFPKIFILHFFCMIFWCSSLYALDLNFKYYKVEDGLSSNTVYDIIQDSDGFIWIGTENGLNRFDGYEFLNFRNIPRDTSSIVNNYVYSLFEDTQKRLWVGTERGISIYDLHKNCFSPLGLRTKEGVAITERIDNILPDEKGQIWITSSRQGIFCVGVDNQLKLYAFDNQKINETEPIAVNCAYMDRDNTLWASVHNSRYQIYKLDKTTDKFVPAFAHTPYETLHKLASHTILEDTFGTLWFGTWSNGLYAVDKKKGIQYNYLNTDNVDKIFHIHSITEYEPGKLLIGSNDGLTSFDVSPTMGNHLEVHLKEPVISNQFVYPIYKDREGGLWIGTYYGGINYASPNRNYFRSYVHDKYKNSISGNVISSFCEDANGNLWIGTDDAGLNHFNTKTGVVEVFKPEKGRNSLSYHNIHALCIDNTDLWIGTYSGGLNVMDMTTKRFKHYYSNPKDSTTLDANNIYSIYKDSRNNIWLGTTSGINRYNRAKDNFERMMLHNEVTLDILETDNRIWFATIGKGLFAYNLDSKQWQNYQFEPHNMASLISNDVISLCVDNDKQLWVGTNSGLCKFDSQSQTFEHIAVNFQSNAICNIFSDNGYLWITTTRGLVRFDPKNGTQNLFTKGDGLLSDQFTQKSGIKTTSGRIYIGTASGFNAFYPKQIIKNRMIPQLGITYFKLFNKSVNINNYLSNDKKEITLAYNNNEFSLEYTALSYYAPEKNEYAFMLQGFDKEWNYVGKVRKATYTNIPPGEYNFKVKASNNDGIWNDTGISIKIIVEAPLWWNKWSISLYLIIFVLSLIWLSSQLRRRDKQKNEEKIEKIKAEQEKDAYNSKINFFTSIAHEIRTPVSLIIGPLEQIRLNAKTLPQNVVADMNIIDRNSQRLLTLVNQLLDFRKIERQTIQISLANSNVYEFLRNIYDRFKPYVEHKKISFVFTYDQANFEAAIDEEHLTKVISNLLNNAAKYTTDEIELSMRINKQANTIAIAVIDNGAGISEGEWENIFKPFYQIAERHKSGTGIGLYLVKSIVDAWGGQIELANKPSGGFIFTIILPLVAVATSDQAPTDVADSNPRRDIEPLRAADYSSESKEVADLLLHDKHTLLIVEDNSDMQEFLHKNLKDEYLVLLADNGKEGISMLEKNIVDIIVSDIMMPQMDGIELCAKLKSSTLWNHIPLVLLTAKTTLSTKIEALEIGADAYIEKPFSISHLSAQLKNLLESRKNLLKKFTEMPFASLKSIAGNEADEIFLSKLNDIIEKNIANEAFSIDNLAEELCISTSGLFAKIKNLTGITPNKLLLLVRLKKAAQLLITSNYRINEICYMVGFSNPSYFAKCFQKQYGVLPKDFRDGL